MTLEEFRRMTRDVPGETEILVPAPGHAFHRGSATLEDVDVSVDYSGYHEVDETSEVEAGARRLRGIVFQASRGRMRR